MMGILVGLGFIGLVAFFAVRKFRTANKKDCCKQMVCSDIGMINKNYFSKQDRQGLILFSSIRTIELLNSPSYLYLTKKRVRKNYVSRRFHGRNVVWLDILAGYFSGDRLGDRQSNE